MSQSAVSRIEAGHIDQMTVATIRAVAHALDATFAPELRWKGGALDRLLDERHAALLGAGVAILARDAWQADVEVSYSHYGERGSIDILAWHPPTATLLVVEVKTELISVEATLRKLDEKVRLAPIVSAPSLPDGSTRRVKAVGRLLVLPKTTTSRRHLIRHSRVLDAAFPLRGTDLRAWLRRPVGAVSGVILIPEGPSTHGANAKSGGASPHRVRHQAARTADAAGQASDG